jgi:hypothetical protein
MDYFPRKSLSKYLITDTIDFNKHVHDIDIFINDKWRKYADGDKGRLFKITRRLELHFWPMRKRSQPSQGDFFALQREPWCFSPIKLVREISKEKKAYSVILRQTFNVSSIWNIICKILQGSHYLQIRGRSGRQQSNGETSGKFVNSKIRQRKLSKRK